MWLHGAWHAKGEDRRGIARVSSSELSIVRSESVRESPVILAPFFRWWARGAIVLALGGLLGLGLVSCGANLAPPRGTLLNALALQIQLTQADVARALNLESVGLPLVSRVRVEQQDPVAIGDNRGLRLVGRFDWRLGKDPFRIDAPFEIFLERGSRGDSWRLARPSGRAPGGEQEWLTYPLPLRDSSSATG